MKAIKTSKPLRIRIVIISILAAALLFVGCLFWINRAGSRNPQIITGEVTAISNACHSDGVCSITLDNNKTIITGCGLNPEGKTCKTYDQSRLVTGQLIKATVIRSDAKTYNLECDTCGIQILYKSDV